MDAIRKQQMLAGVPLKPETREPTHEERKQQMLAQLPVDTAALAERRDPRDLKRGTGVYPMPSQYARQGARLLDDVVHRAGLLMDRKLGGFASLDDLKELLDSAEGIQRSAAALTQWLAKQKSDLEKRMKTEKPSEL